MSDVQKVLHTSGATDSVYKQLRKSFKMVSQQQAVWKTASESSISLVQALVNHAEQLQCCRRVMSLETDHDHPSTVVKQFPDVQRRLEYKLMRSMEMILAKLHSDMQTMEAVCRKHSQHSEHSLRVYHNHYREMGVAKVAARSSTWPSIADMLRWLADIDELYTRLYAEKRWLYDTISYGNLDELQNLTRRWKKNDTQLTQVQNVLARATFFMSDS